MLYNEWGTPKFSLEERSRRWTKVRELMAREDIDAIFAPPNTGLFDMFQANVRYLTGLGGNHALMAAVFPREGEVTAISTPDVHKSIWLERQDWVTDIRNISGGWGFAGAVVERIKELGGIKRLGVTGLSGNTRFPEGVTSHGIVERLRAALPGVELVNANALMEEARFVKSDEEISFLESGIALVERAIDILASQAFPGVSENVVYAHMISSIVEGGGELPSMILWSAGWPQPPSNAYMPTRRPLQRGDIIITETEARWGGYVAQNTQTLFVGKAPAEYHEMFALQQEAIALCYDMLRPGVTLGEITTRVAQMSNDRFTCANLMHGRGLGDDSPLAVYSVRDDIMANWEMKENSVFIVKPTVFSKDGTRKILWGDTVVCTEKGARRLGKRAPSIIEIE
ncbi:M24 family metallopeptidase [Herbaspirillum lusitanum]|uniref:M24 family metallopeptidase n=1 Tax=Herbaspirillum lusitanum TaxID=213312 RepID=UPI0003183DD2|nr:M24 family metallopeptidase [Herbaspirillum lusitanum]